MTSPETTVLRQRLVRAITQRTGSVRGAEAVAAAARGVHDELAAILAPLISESGVEALSRRAFDLAQRDYPAGERTGGDTAAGELFSLERAWLEGQDASAATDAAAAMFATFAELLTTLIGEGLTTRYLEKAWPDVFSGGGPKGQKA